LRPVFTYALAGDDGYVLEGRIPFWKEAKPPKAGDVWGVQLQLNKMFSGKKEPYWLYWWTYTHRPISDLTAFEYDYGRWVFE
jgi:hypothetical protein